MSIIKQKKQRVAIFIDTQNLYHSAKSAYGVNVNFKNILDDTLSDRELVRVIAYVIKTESGEEKSFFEALEKNGIETKSKDLQIFLGGAKKGDWDVGMTIDAVRLAPKVDAVVLISGDGDFIPLVEYLKFSFGCQVEVATFGSSVSSGLLDVADDFFDLSQDLSRYLMRFNYRKYKNKIYKEKKNNYSKKEELYLNEKKVEKKVLEKETPEMVAERISGKRGIPVRKKDSDKIKKATEVEIIRVKKEDLIDEQKNINKVKTNSRNKLAVKKKVKLKKTEKQDGKENIKIEKKKTLKRTKKNIKSATLEKDKK